MNDPSNISSAVIIGGCRIWRAILEVIERACLELLSSVLLYLKIYGDITSCPFRRLVLRVIWIIFYAEGEVFKAAFNVSRLLSGV